MVAASCALPRFFRPVRLGGRDLVDGGIADSLNLDVALKQGARRVLVVNPTVAPLNDRESRCLPSAGHGCGHIAEQGLVAAMGQAIKIGHMLHATTVLRLLRETHPQVSIDLIQPDRMEADLDNLMDFSGVKRLVALGRRDGKRFAGSAGAWWQREDRVA